MKQTEPLKSGWPEAVIEFEAFLVRAGLVRQREVIGSSFDSRFLQYRDGSLMAQIERDRGVWSIVVGDAPTPDRSYDTYLIRRLLAGSEIDPLSLEEQVGFLEANWEQGRPRRDGFANDLQPFQPPWTATSYACPRCT
jgi:hypothetical protein